MAETRVGAIPTPPSNTDVHTRRWMEAVKQALEVRLGQRGDRLDEAVTWRKLSDTGLINYISTSTGHYNFQGVALTPESTGNQSPPGPPINFTVVGGFSFIFLEWDNDPNRDDIAFTEIWRNTEDNLGTAVLLSVSSSLLYADGVDPGQTYYYWVRHVTENGIIGPYNDTLGTAGASALDPAVLLDELQGEINDTHLVGSLTSRIGGIGFDVWRTWVFDTEDGWTATGALSTASNGKLMVDSTSVDPYITKTLDPDTEATVGDQFAGSAYTRVRAQIRIIEGDGADWEGALQFSNSNGDTFSAAREVVAALPNDYALNEWFELEWDMSGQAAWTGYTITGLRLHIANTATVTVEIDWISIGRTAPAGTTNTQAQVEQKTEINGLHAQYTVKIDSGGHVSGFGLSTEPAVDATPSSQFVVLADRFAVLHPNANDPTNPELVFTVDGGRTVMDAAYIKDATITTAKIGLLAVDSAQIANTAITTAKIGDGQITFAKIGEAQVRQANIDNAAVTTLKIGANQVTVPNSALGASLSGNGSQQLAASVSITVNVSNTKVLLFWSFVHGYSGDKSWGMGLGEEPTVAGLYSRGMNGDTRMQAVNDFPSGSFTVNNVPAGTHTFYLFWEGEDNGITAQGRLTALAAMR